MWWCSLSWDEIESLIIKDAPTPCTFLPDIYTRISNAFIDDSRKRDEEEVQLTSPVVSARPNTPLEEFLLQPSYLYIATTATRTSQIQKQESKDLSARRKTETNRYTRYGWKKETRPENKKLFWYVHKSGKRVGSLKKVMNIIREEKRKK